MNRDQKAAVIDEIAADITASQAIFAVDYRGITVAQVAQLRERLRAADASFRVVKNSLTERAADKAGVEELKVLLAGPTALTFARGDGAAAAKAVADFARTTDLLAFKGGFMDGASLSPAEVGAISRLPTREVLYGQLVGIVASPIAGLARTLNALIGGLAVGLGAVLEKRGGEMPPPSAVVEEAEAEAAPDAAAGESVAEAPAVEVADAPAEEAAVEVADAPAEEAAVETADAPAEEAAVETVEAPAEEAAVETADAPAEEAAVEAPAEEAPEAAAETQDAPAEEAAVEAPADEAPEAAAESQDAPAQAEAVAADVQPADESPASGDAEAQETSAPDDETSTPALQGEPGEDLNNESDPGADAEGDDTSKE